MNNIAQIPSRQANKAFILSDFKDNGFRRFKSNPNEYAKSLSKKMRAVFMYLFRFRYKDGIVLSNTVVAHIVGCTSRTVARATRRFHDDGVLLKYHRDTYCLNNYYFHPLLIEGNGSFSLWFKNITPSQEVSYWKQGISGIAKKQKKFVIPYLKEVTKAESTDDNWNNFQSWEVFNSLNGKSRDRFYWNEPFYDLGEMRRKRKLVEAYELAERRKSMDPKGPDQFCFECWTDSNMCICVGIADGGYDKIMDSPDIH